MRTFADGPAQVIDSQLPWDMTAPEMAEERLDRLRDQLVGAEGQLGPMVETWTQIARAQSLQGRLDDAERTLDHAERELGSASELGPKLRLLLERGRLQVLRKTPMVARVRFLEAWEIATAAGLDYYAIDAAQMMSVVETRKKKGEWTIRALELAQKSDDVRVRSWRGPLLSERGTYFAELLQLPKALESFEQAAECFDVEGAARQASMARCEAGRILRLSDRIEDALKLQMKVQNELEDMHSLDGVVFEEIGECLHALKRSDESIAYFARAYKLLTADVWLTNNDPARIKRLKTLGEVKTKS